MKKTGITILILTAFLMLSACDNAVQTNTATATIETEPIESPIETANEIKAANVAMSKETFSANDENMEYTIYCNDEKGISVQLIPNLERENQGNWEKVEFSAMVGFCGTPDGIEDSYTGNVPLSWYEGNLAAGKYRLSFPIVDFDGSNEGKYIISNTFTIE